MNQNHYNRKLSIVSNVTVTDNGHSNDQNHSNDQKVTQMTQKSPKLPKSHPNDPKVTQITQKSLKWPKSHLMTKKSLNSKTSLNRPKCYWN